MPGFLILKVRIQRGVRFSCLVFKERVRVMGGGKESDYLPQSEFFFASFPFSGPGIIGGSFGWLAS